MSEKTENKLQDALSLIDKNYGKGSVFTGSSGSLKELERISSGSLGLDMILGGGYAKGRIVELYGPESSGKTTLCIHAMVQAQKKGGRVAIIDAEHAFDISYAAKLGLNTDELIISQPDTGEDALSIAEILIKSGGVSIVVVDSVAALIPKAELEGEMGDSKMGLQARLMSQALRKLTAIVNNTGTILMFTNQLREKIGVMFGNPETTTGGNALKFYASIRLDVRRSGVVKDGDEVVASKTKVKTAKNKTAPPLRVTEFDIRYGEGIDLTGEVIDMGVDAGFIMKSGSWFSYNGTKLGQGRDAVRTLLLDNPELTNEIKEKILQKYGL